VKNGLTDKGRSYLKLQRLCNNLFEMSTSIGVVIPTMGTRPVFLKESLDSIRRAGHATVCIVAPFNVDIDSILDPDSYESLITDPGKGLSAAIDAGLRSFPTNIQYVNWIGDDDLLIENSLTHAFDILSGSPNAVLVHGGCEYIDEDGKKLWVNRSGSYAKHLMRFGPNLIPQPGSLFKRQAYEQVGGLNHQYKWACDLDLFLRLTRVGEIQFTPQTLAKFRWHNESLSVGSRRESVNEASKIRRQSLPTLLRFFSPLWEIPMKRAIILAGIRLSKRSLRST
jgi:hypothetical protein